MTLRDLAFNELAANLFVADRLSVVFSSGGRQYAPITIDTWETDGRTASARVSWVATESTSIDAANLYDGATLVERFAFQDQTGAPDHARLLPGMTLDYALVVPLN